MYIYVCIVFPIRYQVILNTWHLNDDILIIRYHDITYPLYYPFGFRVEHIFLKPLAMDTCKK